MKRLSEYVGALQDCATSALRGVTALLPGGLMGLYTVDSVGHRDEYAASTLPMIALVDVVSTFPAAFGIYLANLPLSGNLRADALGAVSAAGLVAAAASMRMVVGRQETINRRRNSWYKYELPRIVDSEIESARVEAMHEDLFRDTVKRQIASGTNRESAEMFARQIVENREIQDLYSKS